MLPARLGRQRNPAGAPAGPGEDGVMVASVAVLSDIHGVLPALEAVLAEPEVAAADRIVLTGLPHPVTIEADGFGPVLFCHGTPRDDEEVVLADTRLDRWAEVLAGVP